MAFREYCGIIHHKGQALAGVSMANLMMRGIRFWIGSRATAANHLTDVAFAPLLATVTVLRCK